MSDDEEEDEEDEDGFGGSSKKAEGEDDPVLRKLTCKFLVALAEKYWQYVYYIIIQIYQMNI